METARTAGRTAELARLSAQAERLAQAGASFADVRHLRDERLQLAYIAMKGGAGTRNDQIDRSLTASSQGFGVRVLYNGAWGFGACPGAADDEQSLLAACDRALMVARANAALRGKRGTAPITLTKEAPARGHFQTEIIRDPFTVPIEERVHLLRTVACGLRDRAGEFAQSASAHVGARRQHKLLATSEGTAVSQILTHSSCGMKLTAAQGSLVQHRSYPMDLDGAVAAQGYEYIERVDLPSHVDRIADEILALLRAPVCPAEDATTLILDTPQLALQIHESCGHPTESDRAFGEEVSLAGGSFLTPDRLGRLRYGSDKVSLTAEALTPGALGTFGWDDEGAPARRTPLVERGQFVGYLTSRETAARLGLERSGGCVRAESWNHFPIIRMTNVSLEPDPKGPTLEELIADTDRGILIGNNRSWSIDDVRLNFQFGCEIAWEIRKGKRTRILRDPIYGGITPEFWQRCDAVGGPAAFQMWGLTSCGKGDPMQLMAVGHGCPPARFSGVRTGSLS